MRELLNITFVGVVKVGSLIVQPHSVFLFNTIDELSLRELSIEELCEGMVRESAEQLIISLSGKAVALVLAGSRRDISSLYTAVDLRGHVVERLLGRWPVCGRSFATFLVSVRIKVR